VTSKSKENLEKGYYEIVYGLSLIFILSVTSLNIFTFTSVTFPACLSRAGARSEILIKINFVDLANNYVGKQQSF